MPKSLGTPEQETLIRHLVGMRADAALTQRDLAAILGVTPSWVAKVEMGERRLDVVEFYWWCQAIGVNPADTAKAIVGAMTKHRRRFPRNK